MALNTLLRIAQVDIAERCMAGKVTRRLLAAGNLADCEPGHSGILTHFNSFG